MMNKDRMVCYDLETLEKVFSACFLDIKTQKRKEFVICKLRNDFIEFIEFLSSLRKHEYTLIGFNNLDFDAQVLEFILRILPTLQLSAATNVEEIPKRIYEYIQSIINLEQEQKWKELIPEWRLTTKQLDLYKIWHFDNQAKRTNLKWLQFTMKLDCIESMEMGLNEDIDEDKLKTLLHYNWNDVDSTYEFYLKTVDAIILREKFKEKYNLNCYNWNNGKIGSELLLKLYSESTSKDKNDVRKLRTFRKEYPLGDVIQPHISFKTKEFNDVLERFKSTKVNVNTDEKEKKNSFTLKYKGGEYVYALGGLHMSVKPGVYIANQDWKIWDNDVGSLYPSIGVINNFYPAHLGLEFCKVQKFVVDTRLKEKSKSKSKQDKGLIETYKQALNIPYGKSNEKNSWLYDNKYTYSITINGQLLMTKWLELLFEVPEIVILQVNTDGIVCKVKIEYEKLYFDKCKEFEEFSKFILEPTEYRKIVISTVNDYLAIKSDNSVKQKGEYEVTKELHKNNGMSIVPIALEQYFVNGIEPKDYITNTGHNILDFCKGVKIKRDFKLNNYSVNKGEVICDSYHKVARYFLSKDGGNLVKEYNDKRVISVEDGWKATILNDVTNKSKLVKDYNVDYTYYIEKVEKIITEVEGIKNQLQLF